MAIGYTVTITIFARTAQMVNAWLIDHTNNPDMLAYYMMFGSVLGPIALCASKDRTGQPMASEYASPLGRRPFLRGMVTRHSAVPRRHNVHTSCSVFRVKCDLREPPDSECFDLLVAFVDPNFSGESSP